MKDSHYRVSLDIQRTQSQVSLHIKQGDSSRKVFISLCEGGNPYQIEEDCYAVFSAKKPDKTKIENRCIIEDNTIIYDVTEQTTAVIGKLDCEVKLYGEDSKLLLSPSLTIVVEPRAVGDDLIESSSEYSALTELYSTTLEAIGNAETAAQNCEAASAEAAAVMEETEAVKEATEAVKADVETKLANGEFKGDKGDPADYNLVSNALKGTASGEVVTLTDVSPLEHNILARVSKKNLLYYPYSDSNKTLFGVTWIDNGDGTVTVSGKPTVANSAGFVFTRDGSILRDGVTYSLSNGQSDSSVSIFCAYADESGVSHWESVFTWKDSYTFKTISVQLNAVKEYPIITLRPQLEIGATATEYEPPLIPTTVTLTRYGSNETDNPQTYTPNADGTVDGVTSLYPTTVLTTNTEGVTIDVEYNRDANKVIADLLALIRNLNRIDYINLLSANWEQKGERLYTQVVAVNGVTANSFIEICFSPAQLETFSTKDLSFSVVNAGGEVTVTCVGQKPMSNYRLQVKITEVSTNG